jgi:hypothetical protein
MSRILRGLLLAASASAAAIAAEAQSAATPTFHRDVLPILQQSCQRCHRPSSIAPMSLMSYSEVRRYATRIKERTQLRDEQGAMPPWFIDPDVGIQHFANDEALTDEQIATLAAWVDAGAPEGVATHAPPALVFPSEPTWDIGEPDLVVDLPPFTMEANAPDWWGRMAPAATGLTEDRYVQAMQVLEISDVEGGVGGQYIYHHAILAATDASNRSTGGWPVHEVGRNAQYFDPEGSPLLAAGSSFLVSGAHMKRTRPASPTSPTC